MVNQKVGDINPISKIHSQSNTEASKKIQDSNSNLISPQIKTQNQQSSFAQKNKNNLSNQEASDELQVPNTIEKNYKNAEFENCAQEDQFNNFSPQSSRRHLTANNNKYSELQYNNDIDKLHYQSEEKNKDNQLEIKSQIHVDGNKSDQNDNKNKIQNGATKKKRSNYYKFINDIVKKVLPARNEKKAQNSQDLIQNQNVKYNKKNKQSALPGDILSQNNENSSKNEIGANNLVNQVDLGNKFIHYTNSNHSHSNQFLIQQLQSVDGQFLNSQLNGNKSYQQNQIQGGASTQNFSQIPITNSNLVSDKQIKFGKRQSTKLQNRVQKAETIYEARVETTPQNGTNNDEVLQYKYEQGGWVTDRKNQNGLGGDTESFIESEGKIEQAGLNGAEKNEEQNREIDNEITNNDRLTPKYKELGNGQNSGNNNKNITNSSQKGSFAVSKLFNQSQAVTSNIKLQNKNENILSSKLQQKINDIQGNQKNNEDKNQNDKNNKGMLGNSMVITLDDRNKQSFTKMGFLVNIDKEYEFQDNIGCKQSTQMAQTCIATIGSDNIYDITRKYIKDELFFITYFNGDNNVFYYNYQTMQKDYQEDGYDDFRYYQVSNDSRLTFLLVSIIYCIINKIPAVVDLVAFMIMIGVIFQNFLKKREIIHELNQENFLRAVFYRNFLPDIFIKTGQEFINGLEKLVALDIVINRKLHLRLDKEVQQGNLKELQNIFINYTDKKLQKIKQSNSKIKISQQFQFKKTRLLLSQLLQSQYSNGQNSDHSAIQNQPQKEINLYQQLNQRKKETFEKARERQRSVSNQINKISTSRDQQEFEKKMIEEVKQSPQYEKVKKSSTNLKGIFYFIFTEIRNLFWMSFLMFSNIHQNEVYSTLHSKNITLGCHYDAEISNGSKCINSITMNNYFQCLNNYLYKYFWLINDSNQYCNYEGTLGEDQSYFKIEVTVIFNLIRVFSIASQVMVYSILAYLVYQFIQLNPGPLNGGNYLKSLISLHQDIKVKKMLSRGFIFILFTHFCSLVVFVNIGDQIFESIISLYLLLILMKPIVAQEIVNQNVYSDYFCNAYFNLGFWNYVFNKGIFNISILEQAAYEDLKYIKKMKEQKKIQKNENSNFHNNTNNNYKFLNNNNNENPNSIVAVISKHMSNDNNSVSRKFSNNQNSANVFSNNQQTPKQQNSDNKNLNSSAFKSSLQRMYEWKLNKLVEHGNVEEIRNLLSFQDKWTQNQNQTN
ncbi:hypothetical protein PPERSA_05612 [Pseudocohnilembus persalinus]|uniref:Transmembrane protein n=1 Tax=Pseudocohnilembus persalinus TaxID=266149 RepID=A0A0V0QG98_PSEPJ|nr:hypothetical protein PPERSA_05612 [Pseudocohnilembus persalinus]|eukprot:KRX01212.1 hypothetical protein PPERSA_05612 [Pseudocohnilembus persalinus]